MSGDGFQTEQETFWAGQFGDEYISRNQGRHALASNLAFFSRVLAKTAKIQSCIEFGANIGLNLQALKLLYPDQQQYAVEINSGAARELHKFIPDQNVFETSILDFDPSIVAGAGGCDLALIKGVLIHMNPAFLADVYRKLYNASKRYIMVCEYYNPTPTTVNYRGHTDRLFKRDFAGEIMELYPQLELLDYGFSYHRDRSFPQDDITWFLMEKR
jgi:spore coat polysaccharide biosynthesis protein SpsF